jgi:hypothetical protein
MTSEEARLLGGADQGGKVARRQAAALPGIEQEQRLFGGHRTGGGFGLGGQAAGLDRLLRAGQDARDIGGEVRG